MDYNFLKISDTLVEQVIVLSDKNKNTLGFFPEGGIRDNIKKGHVIVAKNDAELAGYVMFAPVKTKHLIRIIHLCVATKYRSKFVGDGLLNFLKSKYAGDFDGFVLNCRKDYVSATKMWERYSFKNVALKRSSKSENYLITWFYDFGTGIFQNYFQIQSAKACVVLDANIIIKKIDNENEVQALFADWLNDEVEYFITSEMRNELNRDNNILRVFESLEMLKEFRKLNANVNTVRKIEKELEEIFSGKTQNDISDRRQLAETIASEIGFFVTLDLPILNKSQTIYEKYNLNILNPTEFILTIEQIQNQQIYNPAKLEGVNFVISKPQSTDLSKLVDKFYQIDQGEKRHIFNNLVTIITNDINNVTRMILSPEGERIAFWGYKADNYTIDVKYMRVKYGKLSSTLLKQLITNLIKVAVKEKKRVIKMNDDFLEDEFKLILTEFGFWQSGDYLVKNVASGMIEFKELFNEYSFLKEHIFISNLYSEIEQTEDKVKRKQLIYRLERLLYPLKFSDLDIPTYIVPIKFYWASQLFDSKGAESMIYGMQNPDLGWNRENIYYRSATPDIEKEFPARILWYISEDKNFKGRSKQIIACSYLDEVYKDSAKKLFKTFKHYGIFKWKEVINISKNDADKVIKALKFSDTEIFAKGIPFSSCIEIANVNNNFQTVTKINNERFNEIYSLLNDNSLLDEQESFNTLYQTSIC